MSHEAIASRFDEWAESGRGDEMETSHSDVVRQVVANMIIRTGHRVLDLGCGTGWATRLLAEAAPGVQAIGIDVAPRMIARAEERTSLRIRARFECATFEALPFRAGHFDLAFSMEALDYAVDLDAALAELGRVLKPKGAAHVVVDCYADRAETAGWSELMGLRLHHLSESGWRAAFERAGLGSVETRRVHDSRGPGEAADFQPDGRFPDWESYARFIAAGSLWIHAKG